MYLPVLYFSAYKSYILLNTIINGFGELATQALSVSLAEAGDQIL
jgi:hypothetical protein